MSRSGLPQTIFLEFADSETGKPRVVGTDAIMFVDGRWSRDTARLEADLKAERQRDRGLELVGYTLPGDYSDRVHQL